MTWDFTAGFERHTTLKDQDSLCPVPNEIFADRFLITKGGRGLRVPARKGPAGLLIAFCVCIVEIALDLHESRAFDLLLGREFDTIVRNPNLARQIAQRKKGCGEFSFFQALGQWEY